MKATAIRAGFLTSVQDLGRTGLREFGVSLGGSLDTHALRVANLLAGNDEFAAGLEITFGGLRLRFADDRIVVWSGGDFDARIGSTSVAAGHPALVRGGEEFSIESPALGCRAWLAISGGIDVPIVLGSRSGDLKAGFGGVKGRPRFFNNESFFVSPDSDRMGIRLDGPRLERSEDVDLLSEAVAPGTVQVPPSGKPILLLNDCQTIGGYPKIAHVITVDLPIAAQLCPGDRVRFTEVSIADAHALLLERERNLEQFRRGLESHFK